MSYFSKLSNDKILSVIISHIVLYGTPKNISYIWNFGFMGGLTLASQIVTGILVAMHYTPHVDYAFIALEHIMRDVVGGSVLRYLHANGASMFLLLIYIHMFRGLYYGSYFKPRAILWTSGVIIFLAMMATAFMGYVLPWGQMSFWGATVITNLFSAIPKIGGFIVQLLWGGFSVDNPTLNRFFSLHFAIPFIILGLVIFHLILLHTEGSNNPLGIVSKNNKINFDPYSTLKDLYSLFLFIIVFTFFVVYAPNLLGHPDNYIEADSLVTPAHIVPEWYFLPFYAILRTVPDKLGGVVLMVVAIFILIGLPFFDTSYTRSSFFKPFNKKIFWFFFFNSLLLGWLGQKPVEEPYTLFAFYITSFYFLYFYPILPIAGYIEKFLIFQEFKLWKKQTIQKQTKLEIKNFSSIFLVSNFIFLDYYSNLIYIGISILLISIYLSFNFNAKYNKILFIISFWLFFCYFNSFYNIFHLSCFSSKFNLNELNFFENFNFQNLHLTSNNKIILDNELTKIANIPNNSKVTEVHLTYDFKNDMIHAVPKEGKSLVIAKIPSFFQLDFYFLHGIILINCLIFLLIAIDPINILNNKKIELCLLFVCFMLSCLFLIVASNFIEIILCLECMGLCSYILVGFERTSKSSTFVGIQYLIISSVISCLFILGIYFLNYNFATLSFSKISAMLETMLSCYNLNFLEKMVDHFTADIPERAVRSSMCGSLIVYNHNIGIFFFINGVLKTFDFNTFFWNIININIITYFIAFIFIYANFLFKITAAPLHNWAPQIYGKTSFIVVQFLSIIQKVIVFVLIFEFNKKIFWYILEHFNFYIYTIIILTLIFGILGALKTKEIKPFLVYTSMNHVAFILGAFFIPEFTSNAVQFNIGFNYLFIYTISSFILWTLVNFYNRKINYLSNLGIFRNNNVILVYILIIVIFSMSGIPPLAGFFVKYNILIELYRNGYGLITVLFLISSVITFYYYLRIIKINFFENEKKTFFNYKYNNNDWKLRVIIYLSFILVFYILFFNNNNIRYLII